MDEEGKKVLARLERLCARRECCASEIRRKALAAAEGNGELADEIMAALVEGRFVDDGRYAAAFAREKSALTGWGPVKIRLALRAKGIGSDAIDGALEGIDASLADSKLESLMASKAKTLKGDPQARLKLIRFALSRGYEYEAVAELSKKLS